MLTSESELDLNRSTKCSSQSCCNEALRASEHLSCASCVADSGWKLVYKVTNACGVSPYDVYRGSSTVTQPTADHLSLRSSVPGCWYKHPLVEDWGSADIFEVKLLNTLASLQSEENFVQRDSSLEWCCPRTTKGLLLPCGSVWYHIPREPRRPVPMQSILGARVCRERRISE